jgi:hypothetical protein
MTHALIEKLARTPGITAMGHRVLWWFARWTYGEWKITGIKKGQGVRPEFVAGATGYRISREIGADQRTVERAIGRLVRAGVLHRRADGALGINEHYEIAGATPLPDSGRHAAKPAKSVAGATPLNSGRHAANIAGATPLNSGRHAATRPGNQKGQLQLQAPSEKTRGKKTRKRRAPRTARAAVKQPVYDDLPTPAEAAEIRSNLGMPEPGAPPVPRNGNDPWRRIEPDLVRSLQRNATKIIADIERRTGFSAGAWWGRGLKLGRWAPAMIDTLVAFGKAPTEPDNAWAYLETLYEECEARRNSDAAVDDSRGRQKAAGRVDAALT